MTFDISLAGRAALVTGGGHGVGRAVCLAFASAGAAVIVNDFVLERAERVVQEIAAAGGQARAARFDVSDYGDVRSALAQIPDIDILVNNAGNAGPPAPGVTVSVGEFAESEPEDWDRYFAVNLYGVMNCTRAVLPAMIKAKGGRVITVVSDAARVGEARMAPYAAAKAGAGGFMRAIAREVGRHGITVNCVALAAVDTMDLTRRAETDPTLADRLDRSLKQYIIRRLGQPEDPAGLITFLASPQASWITGQTYAVDGGFTVSQ